MKCYAPDAFSGAKFQVFLENDFFLRGCVGPSVLKICQKFSNVPKPKWHEQFWNHWIRIGDNF